MIVLASVPWFPQEYAEQFYVAKALLGLVSVILLLIHMNQTWDALLHRSKLSQRLRYLTLLAFSVLVTGASLEQLNDDATVNYRNLGGMAVTLLLIVAAGYSIRDDRRQKRA